MKILGIITGVTLVAGVFALWKQETRRWKSGDEGKN